MLASVSLFTALLVIQCVYSYRVAHIFRTNPCCRTVSMRLGDSDAIPRSAASSLSNRLKLASNLGVAVVGGVFGASLPSLISKLEPAMAAESGAVAVLGSGGKTGTLIIKELIKTNHRVRPIYRANKPSNIPADSSELIESVTYGDVTDPKSIAAAISGADSVIFAASASSKGGNAKQVDYLGVENVAKECIRLGIPRLVVISSGAITKPNSLGYRITNLFGNIMDYKLQGENALKALYKGVDSTKLSYVIIRPGGLLDSATPSGVEKIELNQGDTISGEVYRIDVAQCAVAAALSKTIPPAVTLEIYEADKSGPLQSEFPKKSGFERTGSVLGGDYDNLFKGLQSDV